jgi:hypothetical protein
MAKHGLNYRYSPDQLQQLGPCVRVDIEHCPDDGQSSQRFLQVTAIIDTGAQGCCISSRLKARLGDIPEDGTRNVHDLLGPHEGESIYRCKLIFGEGIEAVQHFSVLATLVEPYDILIGRDLLQGGQLSINFEEGRFSLLLDV